MHKFSASLTGVKKAQLKSALYKNRKTDKDVKKMTDAGIDAKLLSAIMKYQKIEAEDAAVYNHIALHSKDEKNKEILKKIAQDETNHRLLWRQIAGKNISPSRIRAYFHIFLHYVFGYTFAIKVMEKSEIKTISNYKNLLSAFPQIDAIIKEEQKHEDALIAMLDEERLQYTGAMVLGLNDALVELTGALSGMTFALRDTKLIALAGIITGISAALSMSASNYLAETSNGNPKALRASFYTGTSYIITVFFLVLPYLIFSKDMFAKAFVLTVIFAVSIIAVFNYYISTAKSLPFFKRFKEMLFISFSVTVISFFIGIAAKRILNL
ncbi:MAG: VIT1/CCC1 transporter family protein [Elusimicrobiota bacterium]|jgi:VIT1/CCC1 family predicted Fe2+/Mn2+ transporter|nr:VIT1/CCC1 transporter family protein [Elusimicrobiota bacterium]